jgi:hypothetical protein
MSSADRSDGGKTFMMPGSSVSGKRGDASILTKISTELSKGNIFINACLRNTMGGSIKLSGGNDFSSFGGTLFRDKFIGNGKAVVK